MADTRQITPTGPGTIGGRTHSRKRAAQRRGRDLPGHDDRLLSRHTSERGVEAGQTEAGERPAPFVCRDVACVYRTEAATRAAARRRDPELREERAPTGPDDGSAAGFKRRQVQLEGSRATYYHGWPRRGDRALGKEDRTGLPARPSSLLEGGCHGTTRRGVP